MPNDPIPAYIAAYAPRAQSASSLPSPDILAHIKALARVHATREHARRVAPAKPPATATTPTPAHNCRTGAAPKWAIHRVLQEAAAWLAHNGCHEDAPAVAHQLDRLAPGWRKRRANRPAPAGNKP